MNKHITIIGLGAADIDQLPLGVYRLLTKHEGSVYTRTADHPVIETLQKEGLTFEAFDSTYESFDQFEDVYEAIVDRLLEQATQEMVLYTVPGHPMLAERTVQLLLQKQEQGEVTLNIQGGQSYLDALFTSLKIDPIEGFQFLDATSFTRNIIEHRQHTVFCQVYDEMISSHVKVELMEDLPHDFPVYIVDAAGSSQETIKEVPLYELDRSVELRLMT